MPTLDRRDLLRASIALALSPAIVPLVCGCQHSQTASSSGDVSGAGDPKDKSIEPDTNKNEKMIQVQYLEFVTTDIEAMCALVSKLHGVTFGDPDPTLGGARTAKLSGGGLLGIRAPLRDSEQPVVRPYILVDDIVASVKTAAEAGAKIALPPMKLPGHGTCAIIIQGGIESGLWQL